MPTQVFNLTVFKQSFPVTHNFLSSDSLEFYLRIGLTQLNFTAKDVYDWLNDTDTFIDTEPSF